jgi:hypothetical protein
MKSGCQAIRLACQLAQWTTKYVAMLIVSEDNGEGKISFGQPVLTLYMRDRLVVKTFNVEPY